MKHHCLKRIIVAIIAVLTSATTFSMYGEYGGDETAPVAGSDRITVNGIDYYVNIQGNGASAYIADAKCLGPTYGNAMQTVTVPSSVSCYYYYYTKDENGREYTVTRRLTGPVTEVGEFGHDGNIKSVFIPTTVTKITQDAFSYCENLTSINIPNSVRSIGTFAFGYCINLPEITLPNSLDSVGNSVFFNCRKLSSITIPSSLKYISYAMFNSCVSLKEVNFPPTLTHIFNQAFERCHPLSEITLPESVTYIGYEAFQDCNNLIDCITIPENVNTIGAEAFYGLDVYNLNKVIWKAKNCTLSDLNGNSPFHMRSNMNCLVIGPEVESITGRMFYNFESNWYGDNRCIKSIISHANVPPRIDENCFTSKCYQYGNLMVPYESIEAYREAEVWKNFANIEGFHFGDVDGDNRISIADVIGLVDIIIAGKGEDNPIADADGDGVISIGDVVKLIDIILGK